MPLHKNQTILLEITALSNDGNGVGHHEGQAVFVPFSAVGDKLQAKVTKAAARYAYARIQQVVTPGPGRQKADCPVAGKCGGCSFRHLSYEAELGAKHGFVRDAMDRIGKLPIEVLPPLPSPQVCRYRNKVQYPIAAGPGGGTVFGFYALRSHRLVPCNDCLLQPAEMNEIAAHTVRLLDELCVPPYDETTQSGAIRHITLRQSATTGQVLLCLVATSPVLPQEQSLATRLAAAFPQIATVVLNHNPANTNVIHGPHSRVLFGSGHLKDTLCGVPLLLDEHTFSQVNSAGAEQLFARVKALARPSPQTTLLDLYCGTGVIGLSMARECKRLVGVEVVPQAVESARKSAAAMGLCNTRFICSDAAGAAEQLAQEGLQPDVVVLDPPRKGAGAETIAAVLRMAPKRIVMVSCNPATLARDLAALGQSGYTLHPIQPVDMFPRTRHIECVCLLTKQG